MNNYGYSLIPWLRSSTSCQKRSALQLQHDGTQHNATQHNIAQHNTTTQHKCAVFQRHDATPCLSSWTWMLWQIRQISEHRFKSAACEVSTAVSEAIIIIISAIIANPMMSCWQWWRGRSCMMSEAVKLDYPPPIGSSYSSSFPLPTLHTALQCTVSKSL